MKSKTLLFAWMVSIIVAALTAVSAEAQNGIEYYDCGGVYYRPAFQGNNLVYVVQNP